MAFENSASLIRQLQIALRKEAAVPSYNPDDPALPDLPSLEEAIAEADPSPPYLRCKQCRGRLLRGLQSVVCVFCGAQQRTEIPPDPIPFKSTIAYRCLLDSLDLTGSEAVSGTVATEGLNVSRDPLILSDLFDFELKWPSKPEKNESHTADKAQHQSKSSLNLTGVDLDSFFLEAKETSASAFDDQSIPKKRILGTETSAFPGQESLSFFENAQAPDLAVRSVSTDDAVDESFSGWESEFQSASSQTLEISSPLDAASGSYTDIKLINSTDNDAKPKCQSVPPASMSDSWIPSDQSHSTNTGGSYDYGQFKINSEANNYEEAKVDSNNLSAMNDDWVPDELWTTGITKASNSQKINEDDDSFDTWRDFTSSSSAPDPFSGSWKQTNSTTSFSDELTPKMNSTKSFEEIEFGSVVQPDLFTGASKLHNGSTDSWKQTRSTTTFSDEHPSKMNLVNSTNSFEEIEFGSVVQPDLFTGTSNLHNGSTDSMSYRVTEVKTGGITTVGASTLDSSDAAIQSESVDATAETLMSQMHDLSFMLETELCIPKMTDGFDSIPRN